MNKSVIWLAAPFTYTNPAFAYVNGQKIVGCAAVQRRASSASTTQNSTKQPSHPWVVGTTRPKDDKHFFAFAAPTLTFSLRELFQSPTGEGTNWLNFKH